MGGQALRGAGTEAGGWDSNAEPQDVLVSQAVPQPRLPTPCGMSGSPLQTSPSAAWQGRDRRSPNAPRKPWQARTASIVQAGEAGPRLLSFPENLCAGQREPLSSGLPGLLPRPAAQVSHAVPISQPAFSLCLWDHSVLAPAPFSDASPAALLDFGL